MASLLQEAKVKVISNSYFSDCEGNNAPCYSQLEYEAIAKLSHTLFVVSAGNGALPCPHAACLHCPRALVGEARAAALMSMCLCGPDVAHPPAAVSSRRAQTTQTPTGCARASGRTPPVMSCRTS